MLQIHLGNVLEVLGQVTEQGLDLDLSAASAPPCLSRGLLPARVPCSPDTPTLQTSGAGTWVGLMYASGRDLSRLESLVTAQPRALGRLWCRWGGASAPCPHWALSARGSWRGREAGRIAWRPLYLPARLRSSTWSILQAFSLLPGTSRRHPPWRALSPALRAPGSRPDTSPAAGF